jgi:ATP-grasp domain
VCRDIGDFRVSPTDQSGRTPASQVFLFRVRFRQVKPKILIAATCQWFSTARLAIALTDSGCVVEALCPPYHPLNKTSVVRRIYPYRSLKPMQSLAEAIMLARPDLIVPGDDPAARSLYRLYHMWSNNGKGSLVCELIERSIGTPDSLPLVQARSSFMKLAKEEGIRVPDTEVIANVAELRAWITKTGFPVVLKANGTSGGEGVRIVRTFQEAEHAFRVLHAPPLLARAAKRAIVDHDKTLIWPSLLRQRSIVNAQTFILGHEATSTFASWKGVVLAELHFEVLKKRDSAGPATVLRLLDKPDMSAAAAKIARRLNLSGLHGLDFMIEASSGNAFLIEMNPRTTQVGHLRLGDGRDLAAAMYAAVSGQPLQPSPKVTHNETIALFPQEWKRDPASEFLQSAYHDVPWDEFELIRACIRKDHSYIPTKHAGVQRLFRQLATLYSGSTGNMHRERLDCEAK